MAGGCPAPSGAARRLHRARRPAARTTGARHTGVGTRSALIAPDGVACLRSRPLKSNLRTRLRAWALRRQGQDALPLRLTARRVYIQPTPAGWTFAMLLGV